MRRADSVERTLIVGKAESKRRSGQQRMRWLDSTADSMDMTLSKLRETVEDTGSCRAIVPAFANNSNSVHKTRKTLFLLFPVWACHQLLIVPF